VKLSGLACHFACSGKSSVKTPSMSTTVLRCMSAMVRAEYSVDEPGTSR
jgi:hypothetical protein